MMSRRRQRPGRLWVRYRLRKSWRRGRFVRGESCLRRIAVHAAVWRVCCLCGHCVAGICALLRVECHRVGRNGNLLLLLALLLRCRLFALLHLFLPTLLLWQWRFRLTLLLLALLLALTLFAILIIIGWWWRLLIGWKRI